MQSLRILNKVKIAIVKQLLSQSHVIVNKVKQTKEGVQYLYSKRTNTVGFVSK